MPSSGLPLSVMAMNCSGRARAAKEWQKARVSTVLPDLLERTNSVRARSVAVPAACTACGLVLSNTWRSPALNVSASTSATRLDPPMPHTSVRVRPSARTAAASATYSSHWASDSSGARIHPSRFIGGQT